jgi:dTDP-4-dehydrorhamnose reductase
LTFDRVLITGATGQLGSDLAELLADRAEVDAAPHAELDVADDAAVAARFERARPDVVFNCAAFHNVDVCEREPEPSFEVNAHAVGRLARRCAEAGAKLVHLSTNYVFDGAREEPYTEEDATNPRSVYAQSKLAGEWEALGSAPDALVVRTSGLYGMHGSASKGGNFVTRMLGRAREGSGLKMVADQRLTPTFTADLAPALVSAVEGGASGLVHVTNAGECSWYGFTEEIMRLAGIEVEIEPVETTVPEGGADRPLNGVLARPRADAEGVPELRDWRDALADYMGRAGIRS